MNKETPWKEHEVLPAWMEDAKQFIHLGIRDAARKMMDKHGTSVPLPVFLYMGIVQMFNDIHLAAPTPQDAMKLINEALEHACQLQILQENENEK
jgi:hypothetical protein